MFSTNWKHKLVLLFTDNVLCQELSTLGTPEVWCVRPGSEYSLKGLVPGYSYMLIFAKFCMKLSQFLRQEYATVHVL